MRRALLVGINNYPTPYQLTGCIEDIDSLSSAIERHGDDSKNFDVQKMPDELDSITVRQQIQQLFHDDADVALFYFSGHGYIDANGGQLVFPSDISNGSHGNIGIQMSEIMDIVNTSKVKNKIIILDCCYSGDIGKISPTSSGSKLEPGVSILTACRENETATELGGHGLFTELLCSALNGGAADFSGNITIGSVYAYIDRSLGAWDQRPVFKTNVSEFISIKNVIPKVPNNEIRSIIQLFNTPETYLNLDPSFEDTNSPQAQNKQLVEPYADAENVQKFKLLQKLQSIGFVEPVGEQFMYFAAMRSKQCRLTNLGKFYWRLAKNNRI